MLRSLFINPDIVGHQLFCAKGKWYINGRSESEQRV